MQYIAGENEFRGLKTYQKGIALKNAAKDSFRKVGEYVNLTHQQLSRAVKAEEENRDCGETGRPKSLNQDGIQLFVEAIRERMSRRENTTHRQARDIVSYNFVGCILSYE
jgi:hypothetical protein